MSALTPDEVFQMRRLPHSGLGQNVHRLLDEVQRLTAADEAHRFRYEGALRRLIDACDQQIAAYAMGLGDPFVDAVRKAKEALL